MPDSETFESLRPLMFSIAYRMLASVSEAEDVVQDAFLRHEKARRDGVAIDSPKAYLSAVVTRLSIDQIRSARARREAYVGAWLPEPLLTDGDGGLGDPAALVEQAESLSVAFLLVLQRLNPVERAVFLLRQVFGYEYAEIATILAKSEVNCRQIAARATRHVQAERPRFEASKREREELAGCFFRALTEGDMEGFVQVLAADVVVTGDGGGKAPQWANAVVGAERVARLVEGLGGQIREFGLHVEPREVNGQPGALIRDPDGRLISVFSLDIRDGAVRAIRSVVNPDKLRHIGPVADLRALARGLRMAKAGRPAGTAGHE